MSEAIIQESNGMTLRMQAAIKLRQPSSGIDWLDTMIRNAKRDDFAGQALAGMLANEEVERFHQSLDGKVPQDVQIKAVAELCFIYADAMLKERDK